MNYRIVKMDRRYNRRDYLYCIEFLPHNIGTGVLDFDRSRRWFTDHYGWSQDVETRDHLIKNRKINPEAYELDDINPVWAYTVQYGNFRIYVDHEKTVSWFLLCHPKS